MTKKRLSVFVQEKIGVTPSVAAPGDTNPSDTTAGSILSVESKTKNVESKIEKCGV